MLPPTPPHATTLTAHTHPPASAATNPAAAYPTASAGVDGELGEIAADIAKLEHAGGVVERRGGGGGALDGLLVADQQLAQRLLVDGNVASAVRHLLGAHRAPVLQEGLRELVPAHVVDAHAGLARRILHEERAQGEEKGPAHRVFVVELELARLEHRLVSDAYNGVFTLVMACLR
jgi:hypothetical protein